MRSARRGKSLLVRIVTAFMVVALLSAGWAPAPAEAAPCVASASEGPAGTCCAAADPSERDDSSRARGQDEDGERPAPKCPRECATCSPSPARTLIVPAVTLSSLDETGLPFDAPAPPAQPHRALVRDSIFHPPRV